MNNRKQYPRAAASRTDCDTGAAEAPDRPVRIERIERFTVRKASLVQERAAGAHRDPRAQGFLGVAAWAIDSA